ncbi:HAMP domain-containing protein [Marinobacter adhaerens]|uniref:HAMP domain-containing protein n=1 Tax=Marinobacter adhaerens TaxID=1033846 RepID=UPI001E33294C|nr:HAMP domain-containing protein [Marinobacter adhaerens]MCD1646304.1 HAMP domain-containing protein [Marinobacter adhaerens]
MKISLRTQAVIGIGLIEVGMLMVLLYSVFHFIDQSTRDEVERRAQSIAEVFAATAADDVLSLDLASLQSFVDEVANTPGTSFARVVDYEGRLLAQAGNPEHLTRDFKRSIDKGDLPNLLMAQAYIVKAGMNYGKIEIGLDLRARKNSILALKQRTSVIAVLEVLMAALFSIAAGYYLVRRLRQMTEVVERASSGGGVQKIDDSVPDEVGELARQIDLLNERNHWEQLRSSQRIRNLEELNRLLQRKLADKREF